VINRRILARGQKGTIIQWEPLSMQMCDCLIRFEDGSECWYASHELRPDPSDDLAGTPLLDRAAARLDNDCRMKAQLEVIKVQHRKEMGKPWEGAEFAKAIIGNAIQGAIDDVSERLSKGEQR
jgi:hypothetical protein